MYKLTGSDDNEKRFFWYPGDEGPPLDEAALQNTLKAGEWTPT